MSFSTGWLSCQLRALDRSASVLLHNYRAKRGQRSGNDLSQQLQRRKPGDDPAPSPDGLAEHLAMSWNWSIRNNLSNEGSRRRHHARDDPDSMRDERCGWWRSLGDTPPPQRY